MTYWKAEQFQIQRISYTCVWWGVVFKVMNVCKIKMLGQKNVFSLIKQFQNNFLLNQTDNNNTRNHSNIILDLHLPDNTNLSLSRGTVTIFARKKRAKKGFLLCVYSFANAVVGCELEEYSNDSLFAELSNNCKTRNVRI